MYRGIFRGLKMADCQIDTYKSVMDDIEYIEANTDGLYTVASQSATWLTLCSDRPPATFTSWYIESDVSTFEEYYRKTGITPEAVYFPAKDLHTVTETDDGFLREKEKERMQYFLDLFECSQEERESGTVLWINGWRTDKTS